jgi:hypothetical protein
MRLSVRIRVFGTRPALTGSFPDSNTIGIVAVAALAACAAGGLNATITALTPHQIGRQLRDAIIVALRPAEFDRHIAALEHIRTRQAPTERLNQSGIRAGRTPMEKPVNQKHVLPHRNNNSRFIHNSRH